MQIVLDVFLLVLMAALVSSGLWFPRVWVRCVRPKLMLRQAHRESRLPT